MNNCCPKCNTEMVARSNILFCPRHDIGECSYDALSVEQKSYCFVPVHLEQSDKAQRSACEV